MGTRLRQAPYEGWLAAVQRAVGRVSGRREHHVHHVVYGHDGDRGADQQVHAERAGKGFFVERRGEREARPGKRSSLCLGGRGGPLSPRGR